MRVLALMLLAGLLAACSGPKSLFVVLPDENGKVGEIVVQGKGQKDKKALNTAYASSSVDNSGGQSAGKLDKTSVDKTFGDALKAQPKLPSSFTLYFKADSNDLVQGSEPELERLFKDVKSRGSYRVEVIGHTDSLGKDEYNAKLSLARAEAIAKFLIGRGIPKDRISATGRGERDPLIKTKDETAEPRNRRVEVDVR